MGGLATFGRDEEFDVIRSFASVDGLGALLLEGEPGIGKTTLWRASLEAESAAGRTVLVARPAATEAALGLSGLTDLFGGVAEATRAVLPEPQAKAIGAALLVTEVEDAIDPRALAAGVLGMLRSLAADRPVTVAIDDLQWLDEASVSALAFAVRRLTDERVHLVATVRTAPDGGPHQILAALPPDIVRIPIGPLSPGALHRVITDHTGSSLPRPVLMKVHELTGGNPFYALEAARFLLSESDDLGGSLDLPLPPNLEALVQARLGRLPRPVLRSVEPAALLADPMIPVLEAVSDEPDRLDERLDRAVSAGVVTVSGDRVRFTHPLLAEGAASMIGPRRRSKLHRRLAELVDDPEERARHLALAESRPDAAVAMVIEEGARSALARGAPSAAVDLYERAAALTPNLDLPMRWRRTIEAARACHAASLPARGKHLIAECLAELPPGGDRADAFFVLATIADDDAPASVRALNEAIENAADDAARLSALHRTRGNYGFVASADVSEAATESQIGLAAAERSGEVALIAPALAEVAFMETLAGWITPGLLERALKLGHGVPSLTYIESPRFVLGMRNLYADRVDEGRLLLQEELIDAERRGDDYTCSSILLHLTELEVRAGNFDRAKERAAECTVLQEQRGEAHQGGAGLYAMALVAAHSGRAEEARAAAERGIAASDAIGDRVFATQNQAVLGFLELSLGDAVAADQLLRPLPPWLVEHGWDEPSVCPAWPNAIEALVAINELRLARSYLDQFQERADRCDCPWALATAARCRGLLQGAEGRQDGAVDAFEQALLEHKRPAGSFERGRTLLCYGLVLRRAKRRGQARSRLEEAIATFDRVGAPLWATRARAELARVSGRPRAGGGLTPTERGIAQLVAEGLSNAEVAAKLFLSVRTVGTSLTQIYAKLGIRSRTELAARYKSGEVTGSEPEPGDPVRAGGRDPVEMPPPIH
jgi:DNA-binding CsgD family transcriptional regulator